MIDMKKIVQQTKVEKVDFETGEIQQSESVTTYRIPQEPPFVKVYLNDICALNNVPESEQRILTYMLQKMDYEGIATFTPRYRKKICEDLNIMPKTLNNVISELGSKGLIHILGRGEYELNPNYFGRGSWEEIFRKRATGEFSLTIKYDTKGKREIHSDLSEIVTDYPFKDVI